MKALTALVATGLASFTIVSTAGAAIEDGAVGRWSVVEPNPIRYVEPNPVRFVAPNPRIWVAPNPRFWVAPNPRTWGSGGKPNPRISSMQRPNGAIGRWTFAPSAKPLPVRW